MASRTLEVRITGVDAGGKKVLTGFAAEAESVGRKMQSVGKKMSIGLTAPLLLAARAAFQEMTGAQAATAQTNATIKSTGGVANVTTKEVQDLSAALMAKSGVDDELVQSGANLLLTFRNIRNEVGKGNDVFDRATTAALDLSTAGFGDMASTSKMLGKALNDPIAGINAMSRAGVTFSAEQKTLIRRLVETGDLLGAQKIILKEIETQVGGSAEAYGKTLAGSVGKAREALLNAAGSILSTAGPAFDVITSGAQTFAGVMEGLPGPVKGVVAALGGVLAVAGPVLYVAGGMARNFAALQESATGAKMIAGLKSFTQNMTLAKGALAGAAVAGIVAGQVMGGTKGDMLSLGIAGASMGAMVGGGAGAAVGAVAGLGLALMGSADSAERTTKQVGYAERSIKDFAYWTRRSGEELERHGRGSVAFRDAQAGVNLSTGELVTHFKEVAKESPKVANELLNQAQAAGVDAETLGKLRNILDNNSTSQDELEESAVKATLSMAKQGRQAELTADQIQTLNDLIAEGINTQLGVEGALLNVESATARYSKAVADSGADSLEAREAQLALQQSYIATSEAIMENADANRDGKVSADEAKAATQKQIETLSYMAAGLAPGSKLRVFLDEYIWQLASGIPKSVGTTLTVDTTPGRLEIARWITDTTNALRTSAAYAKLRENNLTVGNIVGLAKGGRTEAGTPYLVGEEGMEVFVPDTAGQIIPNHKLGSGGTSLAAGGGVVIHIYANNIMHDREFQDLAVDAITRARREGVAV